MVYCITADSTANCVLPIVYALMIVANISFILLVFKPAIDDYLE
jgi:hypothetical protein